MIIGIEGPIGSGKTILMVRYLRKDFVKGKAIFANLGLKNMKYEKVDMSKILDMHENQFNLNKCSLGIDEITVFADCRCSGSKLNRLISYFILQSRKRNVDIYFTTQNLNMVDFRLIDYMDLQINCHKVLDKRGQEIEGFGRYIVYDLRDAKNIGVKEFILDYRPYYKYYDTFEVILPLT
jgi:hypothetical protein